jgi:hypothetical protein
MKRLTITFAVLAAALAGAPAADASSRQLLVMQDDSQLRAAPTTTLDQFASFGTDVVKVNLYWDHVAPRGRRKPSGFDGADPASYAWGEYDAFVQGILARGMRPYFSVGGRAPDWASKRRGRRGTYRPNAREFRAFAEAAGRHFQEVRIWSIWNEPNLYSWLSPQRRKRTPLSPSIYRGLYLAGHRGLEAAGHGGDKILFGELMPRGGSDRRKLRPLEFLREMVCLDRRYRQYRGAAARRRGCRGKVRRIPTSGFAYHPYTLAGGPSVREARDDASIGQLSRIRRTLDALARRGKLPRRTPIWITEFGYQTRPPDRNATPLRRAAGLMDLSEWIAFRNPRVASYSQYTLRDDDFWQGGLRFADGRPKRGVLAAFRLPFFVRSLGRNAVEVFGGLRAASGANALIESKAPGRRYRSLGSISLNSAGYFRQILRVRGGSRHKYRVTLGGFQRVKKPVAR